MHGRFGTGAGINGVFQQVPQKGAELRLRDDGFFLHLDRNLHIGLLPHRLLPIVMQYGIHRIILQNRRTVSGGRLSP